MLEGGAAGIGNMRSARSFDNEGGRIAYSIQGMRQQQRRFRRAVQRPIVASNTWGSFGALVGVAGVHNQVKTTGFETIGWTNPNLTVPGSAADARRPGSRGAMPGWIGTLGTGGALASRFPCAHQCRQRADAGWPHQSGFPAGAQSGPHARNRSTTPSFRAWAVPR